MQTQHQLFTQYASVLKKTLDQFPYEQVEKLANALKEAWIQGKRVYVCGNGGSAANAMHMANDLFYGVSREDGRGIKISALTADSSIMTCLANDVSYEAVFSHQIINLGEKGDVLLALSGSGNSPNIVKVLQVAKEKGLKTFAILGYSGGKCLNLADVAIHFKIDDMQIAEDAQLIVGHMVMRWLCETHQKG